MQSYPKISPCAPPIFNQCLEHSGVSTRRTGLQQLIRDGPFLSTSHQPFLLKTRQQGFIVLIVRLTINELGPLGGIRSFHIDMPTASKLSAQLPAHDFSTSRRTRQIDFLALSGRVKPTQGSS